MPSPDALLVTIRSPAGEQRVRLCDYLTPAASDRAHAAANHWIKSLRRATVEGRSFRDRFTYRDDSLWWFAELYLHKTQLVASVIETIEATSELVRVEQPESIAPSAGHGIGPWLVPAAARHLGIRAAPAVQGERRTMERVRLLANARAHTTGAVLSRLRRLPVPAIDTPCDVAVFVHSAFWRGGAEEDAYLGPVLAELLEQVAPDRVRFVGLGPRTNFRSRGWRQRARELRDPSAPGAVIPVEAFAPRGAIAPSMAVWRARRATQRALLESPDVRRAAVIDGVDVWPVVADLMTGISHLQFPWSARAMDEAGAALDHLRPRVVFTYAEAGGWGRALMLEARRRDIPTVALQHGFIYRHWLNYLHEPDELAPSSANPADRGFPLPTLTLAHDGLAAEHLVRAGHFPERSVTVTGSTRLDTIVRSAGRLTPADKDAVRQSVGAQSGDHLVLVASKFSQIGAVFGDLLAACGRLKGVRLVVKCHPGESAEPYERAIGGARFATVVSSGADLGKLLASARLLVTVNSTAAIEALVLGVPALVLALPNNLSPFVEAGVMAGAERGGFGGTLEGLLYDEPRRAALADARRRFIDGHRMGSDQQAARRAVAAITSLMNGHS